MKVLIVGGGFCGAPVAKKLEKIKEIKTVLIDDKNFFEYKPALPNLLVNKKLDKEIKLKYTSFLKNTELLCEKVEHIYPDKIKTEKNSYSYDYLVICRGISYPIFLENKNNVFTINNLNQTLLALDKLTKSDHILIVGGGLIGVEVASEIITKLSGKKVTIVHSKNHLIERNTKHASKIAEAFLRKNNVNIIFEEKIIENKDNIFITDNGRKIKADMAIWSAGTKCDSSFMEKFDRNIFSSKGCLKVDKYLRLKGYENIFVGGDITDIFEEKTAQNSERHAKLIVKNIKNIIDDKPLKTYHNFSGPLFISLGKNKGIFIFRNFCFSGYMPLFIKKLIQWYFLKLVIGSS